MFREGKCRGSVGRADGAEESSKGLLKKEASPCQGRSLLGEEWTERPGWGAEMRRTTPRIVFQGQFTVPIVGLFPLGN